MRETNNWWDEANCGIVGLGPIEDEDGRIVWPTEGYDGPLTTRWDVEWEEWDTNPLAASGRTKEEWLALADAMIARWAAWRERVAALTDPSTP